MSNNNLERVAAPTKFTKEIKENWLAALKSGKFIQGYGQLEEKYKGITRNCCLGVLGIITEGLDNSVAGQDNPACPYKFMGNYMGEKSLSDLYRTNDSGSYYDNYEGGYANVIPLIEALPTQD